MKATNTTHVVLELRELTCGLGSSEIIQNKKIKKNGPRLADVPTCLCLRHCSLFFIFKNSAFFVLVDSRTDNLSLYPFHQETFA